MAYSFLSQIPVWEAPSTESLPPGYYPNYQMSRVLQQTVTDSAPFTKKVKNVPGQPYQINISPEEVEKQLYSNLQVQEIERQAPDAQPQEVVQLNSGLQVPAYILKRDSQRKEIQQIKSEIEATKPPLFFIGEYAKIHPGKASLAALGFGMLLAHYLL